jgi:hypothetical protein
MWFETSGSRFCGSSERAGFSYVDFRLNEVANSLRQFKNPRIQRVLERHASLTPPFVGLYGYYLRHYLRIQQVLDSAKFPNRRLPLYIGRDRFYRHRRSDFVTFLARLGLAFQQITSIAPLRGKPVRALFRATTGGRPYKILRYLTTTH